MNKILFKILMLKGDAGEPTDEQTQSAVDDYMQAHPEAAIDETIINSAVGDWLDEHPEATTTVQDGSLTEAKFTDALKLKTIKDYITPQMFGALGDGIADDTQAIQAAIDSQDISTIYFPKGVYMVSAPIIVTHSDQAGLSHSILMDRNAVLKASASIESVLHFTQDSTHQNNNIRDYLDGEFLEGGNIDGNGLAKYCCIFEGNGRMSCSLTNFYDAITANVWVINGRFNMYNVEVSNNFNTSENYNPAHENVIGILNDSPDSHFWDIYLSWCKFGIKNNAGAFYERIHGVMGYRGYDGSVFFDDGNTVITTITDCYSDNYNTAYKLKGSCNLNKIMAYYWMSAADLISSTWGGETHTHTPPVVLDISERTITSRIFVDGLRIIPTDTSTRTIIGIKIGDGGNITSALSHLKISNVIARYPTNYRDWLIYFIQKNSDLDSNMITENYTEFGGKYIHLFDYVFYNYNKTIDTTINIQSTSSSSPRFNSSLNMNVNIGTQQSGFDAAYVKTLPLKRGTSGSVEYYLTKSVETMADGATVKILGVWMRASENAASYMLSGVCDVQSKEYLTIPIRYVNEVSDNAPSADLTVNAVGLKLENSILPCEIGSSGTIARFTIPFSEPINTMYTPVLNLSFASIVCDGAFLIVTNATIALERKTPNGATFVLTFPTAQPSLNDMSGSIRLSGEVSFE